MCMLEMWVARHAFFSNNETSLPKMQTMEFGGAYCHGAYSAESATKVSVKIMGLVWDLDNSQIDRGEKYILLAYADHADHQGKNIFPAIATICKKTGYKEREAQVITRSLEQKGYLVEDGQGPHGTNKW